MKTISMLLSFLLVQSASALTATQASPFSAVISARGQNEAVKANGRDSSTNGGNGGNVLVYYTELADLLKVQILAKGGKGGRKGKPGKDGTLHLIKTGGDTYQDQILSTTLTLQDWLRQPALFQYNQWKKSLGANLLLAPNSLVADEYLELERIVQLPVQISWQANRQPTDAMLKSAIQLSLAPDLQTLNVIFPYFYVATYSVAREGDVLQVKVTQMLEQYDILDMQFAFTGIGAEFAANVTDVNSLWERSTTKATVLVYELKNGRNRMVKEVAVPALAMEQTAAGLTLKLGQIKKVTDLKNGKRLLGLRIERRIEKKNFSNDFFLAQPW